MAANVTANLTRGSARIGQAQTATSACRAAYQQLSFAAFSSVASAAPQLRPSLLTSLSRAPQGGARKQLSKQQTRAMGGVTQPESYAFDIYCKGAPEGGNPSLKGELLDCEFLL